MSAREVKQAANDLMELIDEVKLQMDSDSHLRLSNAVMVVHQKASALEEGDEASDEELEVEEEEIELSSEALAEQMVDVVEGDEDDFADLVSGLHVWCGNLSVKPKAAAIAITRLVEQLDRSSPSEMDKLHKWKNLFIALDGFGKCGYILKQTWLADDATDDADPTSAVLDVMRVLSEDDPVTVSRMRLRGNMRALEFVRAHTDCLLIADKAHALLKKLEGAGNVIIA